MTGIFRANNPLNTSLLFIYGLLLKLSWFIHPQIPVTRSSDGFLWDNILSAIKPALDPYPLTYSIIAYLFLFTQAVSLNHFVNSRKLMQKPNYLPAMSYLLITSFFPQWNILSAPLLINSLLIWIYGRLTNLYKSQKAKTTLFNLGLAIGLCSFLYFPILAFIILILFSLLATRPFRIAEWIVPVLGILTAWYFLFTWLFLTDGLYTFSLQGIVVSLPPFLLRKIEFVGLGIIVAMTFAGIFYVQSNSGKQVVQVRKSWTLMVLYLLVALFIPFINTTYYFEYWILAIIPVAAFAGSAFFYINAKWISALIQWLMVAFVIYLQYLS